MIVQKDIEDALDYMDSVGLIKLSRSVNHSTGWQQLHCPFHNNGQEKRPSCGCSLTEQTRNGVTYHIGNFHCFSCGAAYSFADGIREIFKLKNTSIEAHPTLRPFLDNQPAAETDSLIPGQLLASVVTKYAADDLRLRMRQVTPFVSEQELASYRYTVPYMYQRKLTDAVIEKYDIGYDANHIPPGRTKPLPCVTFPVHDMQGRTLFICRRSIEGKYFNLPTNLEKSVFGLYEIPKGTKEVIICESVFNALTCVVYGRPAVALFGTGTAHEIEQLKRLGVSSYVICLDNDEAGRKGTAKLKKALSENALVWTMTVPEGKDVNDLTYEEFEACYATRE